VAPPGPRVLAGAALVVVSCSAVQGSAALSSTVFDTLSPAAVAAWRQAFGALALLAILHPRLAGRTRAEWASIGVLGAAIATMNVAFYQAVDLIPLGVAATLLYLGPFALAVAHTEVGWHLIIPALALVGVVLVSRPTGDADPVGIFVGLVAAAALAAYTLASQRLGRAGGLDRLALAVAVSALLLSPLSASSAPAVQPGQWLVLAASGLVGVGVAFSCDFTALRLAGTRVVATLFALDPVIGALIGAIALSQQLTLATLAGIGIITIAGAATTATTPPKPPGLRQRHRPASRTTAEPINNPPCEPMHNRVSAPITDSPRHAPCGPTGRLPRREHLLEPKRCDARGVTTHLRLEAWSSTEQAGSLHT
jgi:inner membrane transporter RhtA